MWEVYGRNGEEEGGWQVNVRRILENKGQGWLKRLDSKRNKGQEEEAAETDKHVSEG